MSEYNGWTNRETWLVQLYFGDALNGYCEPDEGIMPSPDFCESYVREYVETRRGDDKAAFISDCVSQVLGRVNWYEIASAAN